MSLAGWPGKMPPTPGVLRVLKCIFAVSERGTGADLEEVRDLLVLEGMTEAEADAAISDAEDCGVIYGGQS